MGQSAHDFCAQKAILGPPLPPPATAASDPNQSFQGRVWTLDNGWKHLVGFKYAGWGGVLHRPKGGSLLQLRSTLFVHLSQTAILGPPPAPPNGVSDANQSFQGRV